MQPGKMNPILSRIAGSASSKDSRRALPLLLSLLYMLIKAVNNLLYLSVLTTFLEKAGANSLPWVYLVVNVCFIFIQFRFITRIAGFEGHWLLKRINLPMIILSFSAALFLPAESTLVLIAFLVAAMLTDLTSNQAFTAMLNHFLSLSESKRILPFVYASGSLGYILSGLTLKFVIDLAGFNGLLILNGIFAIVGFFIISKLNPFEQERLENNDDEDSAKDSSEKETIQTSLKHPLARLLICSSFLIIFNRYLIDFLFAAVISNYFASGKDLASFMGIFGAAADLLVIGLQTFVMKAVFSSLPVGRVLTFLPAVLTFLCLVASLDMRFAVVASIQFLVMINSKNFTVPATTLLMGVIPQKQRVVFRRDMSVACAVASTLVGLFLLLVRNNIPPTSLFFIAAGVYLALATIHFMLDKAYLQTLKSQIVSDEGDEEKISSIRYLKQKDRLEQLTMLLKSDKAETRILAIKEVGELPESVARPILQKQIALEPDCRCIAEIARIMVKVCGSEAFRTIEELIASSEDCRLKADLLEAVGKLRGAGEETVQGYLIHPHHRVKSSAVISLLKIARDKNLLEAALSQLASMAKDSGEMMRASAAAIMGEVGLPLFLPCLEELATESNQAVAVSAVNAIARIQSPSSLACLEKLKSHPVEKVAQTAAYMADTAVKKNAEQIGRLLTSITAEERLLLASRIRKMGQDENFELLSLILCVEDVALRKRLIGFFEKAEPEIVELLSRCLICGGDQSVVFTLAPAFSLALDEFYLSLPPWVELLRAIGAGTLEDPESHHFQACRHYLCLIWAENIVAATLDLQEKQKETLKKRTRVACELACCLATEPVALLKSLQGAVNGSAYAKSLAVEYIETRIGRKTADLILPLLEVSQNADQFGPLLLEKAQATDFEISANSLENARARLLQNLKSVLE